MKMVNIGFGNLVNADRIISIIPPDSAPAKRMIQLAKVNDVLIDATHGRKTMSVIITDTDNVILSYMDLKQISEKFNAEGDEH